MVEPPESRAGNATGRRFSWLSVTEAASAAFVGTARITEVSPGRPRRGSGRPERFRLAAEITPVASLFGALPGAPLPASGGATRDPASPPMETRFPPDALRKDAFWEHAVLGKDQAVLALLTEPVELRALEGDHDPLPASVQLIRSWLQVASDQRREAVLAALGEPRSPVLDVAGFELLLRARTPLAALFERFEQLPQRAGAAIAGILDALAVLPQQSTDPEALALADSMLAAWSRETDPAALSAYLLWFDGAGRAILHDDSARRGRAQQNIARTRALTIAEPLWASQVDYYASVLLSRLNQ